MGLELSIEIVEPADISTFESGDSITFEMLLTVNSRVSAVIKKGTIIQWTSDRDGDFWREEVDHDITGVKLHGVQSTLLHILKAFRPQPSLPVITK